MASLDMVGSVRVSSLVVSRSLTQIGLLVLGLALAHALGRFIYNVFFHHLAGYPGPLLYRGSELPRLVQELRGTTIHKWVELHQRYGPVVRIAPGQLSYISNNAWRDIYGSRGCHSPTSPTSTSPSSPKTKRDSAWPSSSSPSDRSPPPSPLKRQNSQMSREEMTFPGDDFEFFEAKPMISCDTANHTRHRRVIGTAFSDRAVREYEPVVVEKAGKLMEKLEERAVLQQTVNIVDWFNFAMFDITSTLVFAESFGCLDREAYHPWVARVFPGMKLIALSEVIAAIPGLGALVARLVPQRLVDEAARHVQAVKDMTDRRVAMHRHHQHQQHHQQQPAAQQKPDFMTHILSRNEQPGGGPCISSLSQDELYLDAQLLAIAGSETTATLLSGAVYYLSRYPRAASKLARTLRSTFASEADITPASAAAVPYVVAVINEALRLYPPGAINMPRTVPPGGSLIDGRFVPGGSTVGFAQYAAYRSPVHFTDPLGFVPERWTGGGDGDGDDEGGSDGSSSSKFAGDQFEVFRPFSYGPRNCVGQNLALLEIRYILARLVWRFDVQVLPGQEAWTVGQKTYLSWVKPPLMVMLRSARARGLRV